LDLERVSLWQPTIAFFALQQVRWNSVIAFLALSPVADAPKDRIDKVEALKQPTAKRQ
jgi:hypothetical protein